MSHRALVLLSLGLAATLHCGDVLGQDSAEPGTLGLEGRAPSGGEETPPSSPAPASCLDALAATGATFRPLPAADDAPPVLPGCGMIEPVLLTRGAAGITYQPALRVSCAFALALPAVERTIQAVAGESLGEPVEVARVMGSYGCRTIQSERSPGRLSEHAFGNAIDVGELWTRAHHAVVLRDFRRDDATGAFLRAVAERLRASGMLERLLDPDTNAAHQNHFHLEGHPLR